MNPPPAPWTYTFELFTGQDTADEWALAAAIFIAQYRRRHSCGPTFRELFLHLLPDGIGLPSPLPPMWDEADRRRALYGFRRHVTVDWRRRGYIGFGKQVVRSLRVGPEFRERSKSLRQSQMAIPNHQSEVNASDRGPIIQATLTTEQVMARLNIGAMMLRRLRKGGFLIGFETDNGVRYPLWQFSDEPGRAVIPGISAVVSAMPPTWSILNLLTFMLTRQRALETRGEHVTPVQWLVLGEDPERVSALLSSRASHDDAYPTPHPVHRSDDRPRFSQHPTGSTLHAEGHTGER